MSHDISRPARSASYFSMLLTVAGGWSIGHLILLWALPRTEGGTLTLYGVGLLSGLAAGLVGTTLSRIVLQPEFSVGIRKRALFVIGFLPPAIAGLTLLFAASDFQETQRANPVQAGAGHGEAFANAVGTGFGTAVASAALMIIGFGIGALLASLATWFLWAKGATSPGRGLKCGLCMIWLVAVTSGVLVFLYFPQ